MQPDLVPAHLRQYVVRQDYGQYTAEDQAIWRFAVRSTHTRLLETAHAAYARGFEAAGISVDRIPSIDQMSDRLEQFGWRAVAVDGFIPPRAFQAFQARGILPIAADIRTSEHLTYTPAPDIIHEAAGHAPFLAEPHYARYVQRIGEVAERAFASRADREVYDAIYTLSEVKENPAHTAEQMERAERALERATRAASEPSEAAKVARLYWWTAEYGLIGTPSDFRLYGAGLLSSVGEGHFCRSPGVPKLPLTPACIEVDYDITRAQPRLFVTRSFAELEEVLDRVAATLGYRIGGAHALEVARRSEELATLELVGGTELVGVVSAVHEDRGKPFLVELSGRSAVARDGVLLDAVPEHPGYALPLGALDDGTSLSRLTPDALRRRTSARGRLDLRLVSGLRIGGQVRAVLPAEGRAVAVLLDGFDVTRGEQVLYHSAGSYPLVLSERVRTASARAPNGFFAPTRPSLATVPKPRTFDDAQQERIRLHERAVEAWRGLGGGDAARELGRIADRLDARYPGEWLLRFQLLEALVTLGEDPALADRLARDLERLEIRFQHREPIATGLGYIRSLGYRPLPGPALAG